MSIWEFNPFFLRALTVAVHLLRNGDSSGGDNWKWVIKIKKKNFGTIIVE